MKRALLKPSQAQSNDKVDKIRKTLRSELLTRYKEDRLNSTSLRRNITLNGDDDFSDDENDESCLNIRDLILADQEKFASMDEFELELLYDDLAPVFDEMKQEILSQVEQNYFESLEDFENSNVEQANRFSDDFVLCPICRKFKLGISPSNVTCTDANCSMKLNVEQDCINLNFVKSQLNLAQIEHNENCNCNPIFSVEDNFGIANLFMLGSKCDFFHIVL